MDPIDFGFPGLRWDRDGRHFSYEKIDRGHQRYRLIREHDWNRDVMEKIAATQSRRSASRR